MKKLLITLLTFGLTFIFAQSGKTIVTIKDSDITGNQGIVKWTKDKVYLLDGYVYVEAGTTLEIEAGTVIKAKQNPSNGSDKASVLVISRGAKIDAQGTRNEPIIFTAEADDVTLPDDGTDPGVDFRKDKGLWGGVLLLGKAKLNVASEKVVEGMPADDRAKYGGDDDADNSGIMRYVSIRYTGITVEANKELQGLTGGCVGSGTVLEYIESFNSSDDGFEFFGGTVNTKYLIAAFADDDGFDFDQGFRGVHQYWFAIQNPTWGDHIGEWDGGDSGALTNEPLSKPIIYNATFLGRGLSASYTKDAINIKEYGGVEFYNSIISDFSGKLVVADSGAGQTSYTRWQNGEVKFQNNIMYKGGAALNSSVISQSFMRNYLLDAQNKNYAVDPMFEGISRVNDKGLDPRPKAGSPALVNDRKPLPAGNSYLDDAQYIGAFYGDLWLNGWTALYENNITAKGNNLVDIEETKEVLPTKYTLLQNYPNPFNPSTTIEFQLPVAGKVNLIVLNILGQKVAELADGEFQAGSHKVTFNANNLSSGVYIYRLVSGNTVITKKMLLVK